MNHVVVREMASSESRSTFCSTESPIKMTCETDDTETCTKALRLVSGSDSAVHPRSWPNIKLADSGFELTCAAYNLSF